MNGQEIIDEMAQEICKNCRPLTECKTKGICTMAYKTAEYLTDTGWKKEIQAEWIKRENKSPTQIEAYCSICGRDAVYQVIDNRWQFENYCPHCGAKMRGE